MSRQITHWLLFGLTFCLGCLEAQAPEEDDLLSSGADLVSNKQNHSACQQRWQAPTVPSARSVGHSSARHQCSGRAQSGAIKFGAFIRNHFGNGMDLRVPGDGIQIYNCRSVRGGRSRSVHGDGRAVDIFIPTLPGGVADNAKGDPIANWLATNAEFIGIQYIIWDRTSFKSNRGEQSKCYSGTHPHNDHIHVELTWAAAREDTPFFQSTSPEPPQMAAAPHDHEHDTHTSHASDHGGEPSKPVETSGQSDAGPTTAAPIGSWLGEPCDHDSHCIQTRDVPATCVVPDGARTGFCSVSCDGLCPDRAGHSGTFCGQATMVGLRTVGLCMAKAQAANGYCGHWPDFEPFDTNRYIESANVRAQTAVVCTAMPPPSLASEDNDPSQPGTVCDDPSLPLSDHGYDCTGFGENTWRCGCSARFETAVSQVCRNGAWTNYELNPRDCAQCNGSYSSACDP